ncbi:hypothetical protein C4B68_27975 [Streptomyces dengpaensis]|uniref:PPM-type phosphatase domain-containing protein n=1 Tax=Streptomyces dengpaensis TaxID=2049881 RepID=A0ABN5I727_9ACTN|nr:MULTISPECIES: SpoIIE family protein phosphatase [Streptomyces]AVH58964.1 hypothetical protein C4B68_27975 [Streptomyces dengpaensis]PIB10988.1 hypothetical protein B1C81_03695 [Streptomyces sp. HG99]
MQGIGLRPKIHVTADGSGVVGHAGARLLADLAEAMGQVRASIRAIAAHEPDPATVLTRINELLVTMGADRFASCTMLHLDPRDGQVTGASAGHVPLLYAHKDGFPLRPGALVWKSAYTNGAGSPEHPDLCQPASGHPGAESAKAASVVQRSQVRS